MIGIYKITNLTNGKSYIGQSVDIEARWKNHQVVSFDENNKKYNYPLSQAIRKYGSNSFDLEILEECKEEELTEKEIYYYNLYQPEYCLTSPNEHFSQNEETRKKISEALTGRKLSKEHIEKIRERVSGAGNPNAKEIKAIGLKGTFYFKTQMEAAKWVVNNNLTQKGTTPRRAANQIHRVYAGIRKSAYGFTWLDIPQDETVIKYTTAKDKIEENENVIAKEVFLNKDGKNYDFYSTREAAEWLIQNNYTKSKEVRVVQNGLSSIKLETRKSYYGFTWGKHQ